MNIPLWNKQHCAPPATVTPSLNTHITHYYKTQWHRTKPMWACQSILEKRTQHCNVLYSDVSHTCDAPLRGCMQFILWMAGEGFLKGVNVGRAARRVSARWINNNTLYPWVTDGFIYAEKEKGAPMNIIGASVRLQPPRSDDTDAEGLDFFFINLHLRSMESNVLRDWERRASMSRSSNAPPRQTFGEEEWARGVGNWQFWFSICCSLCLQPSQIFAGEIFGRANIARRARGPWNASRASLRRRFQN